jgi:crotonobetainyl-CoA:carnitine CoA-transferase CaiB-like acyl-CoA transferase
MQMVGNPGEAPPLLRIALGDMYTGAHGVASVCAALLGRVKSGKGQHIDLALYDCLVAMHEYSIQCYTLSGGKEVPVQTGHDLPHSTLYGVFSASDGDLVIAAQQDDAWKRFAPLVGGPALANDERLQTTAGRNQHRELILPIVRAWTAARTVQQCLSALDAIDVPSAKVQRIDEVLADPQIIARNMVPEQDHPRHGKIRMPNLPFRFSDCTIAGSSFAPLLGEHNREVAQLVGYSELQIDQLERDGVLYAKTE